MTARWKFKCISAVLGLDVVFTKDDVKWEVASRGLWSPSRGNGFRLWLLRLSGLSLQISHSKFVSTPAPVPRVNVVETLRFSAVDLFPRVDTLKLFVARECCCRGEVLVVIQSGFWTFSSLFPADVRPGHLRRGPAHGVGNHQLLCDQHSASQPKSGVHAPTPTGVVRAVSYTSDIPRYHPKHRHCKLNSSTTSSNGVEGRNKLFWREAISRGGVNHGKPGTAHPTRNLSRYSQWRTTIVT